MNEEEELEKQASLLQEANQKRIDEIDKFVKEAAARTNSILDEEDDGLDHVDLDDGADVVRDQPMGNPYAPNPFAADTQLKELDKQLQKIREEDTTQQRVESILQKVRFRQQKTASEIAKANP